LREACGRAKITLAIGFHIRHTYASRLVMRGVPMSVVAQQIGDSEIPVVTQWRPVAEGSSGTTHSSKLGTISKEIMAHLTGCQRCLPRPDFNLLPYLTEQEKKAPRVSLFHFSPLTAA
jgi:hypothetical protein